MEDSVCAGRLVKELGSIKDNVELSDSAKCAVALNQSFGKNILTMLKETEHGKLLAARGFEDDLKICSKLSVTSTVPFFNGSALQSFKV